MEAIYSHLRAACRWGDDQPRPLSHGALSSLVGGIAVALPLALAMAGAGLPAGLAMSLGALTVSGIQRGSGLWDRLRGPLAAMTAACLAIIVAGLIAGHGFASEFATVTIATAAAFLIRYSREVAIASIRFIFFLVIVGNALAATKDPGPVAMIILLGAIWAGLLVMLVNLVLRRKIAGGAAPALPPSRESDIAVRLARMRRELRQRFTWDFPARLFLGLFLSVVIRILFPAHFYGWVSVTVALLTPRQFEAWPVRATQRAIGTVLGVACAAALLVTDVPAAMLILVVFVLGSLRKWVEDRSYLAYSATMAPLVLLLLSANHGDAHRLMTDRVVSTLIGILVVLLCNQIAARTTMAKNATLSRT